MSHCAPTPTIHIPLLSEAICKKHVGGNASILWTYFAMCVEFIPKKNGWPFSCMGVSSWWPRQKVCTKFMWISTWLKGQGWYMLYLQYGGNIWKITWLFFLENPPTFFFLKCSVYCNASVIRLVPQPHSLTYILKLVMKRKFLYVHAPHMITQELNELPRDLYQRHSPNY